MEAPLVRDFFPSNYLTKTKMLTASTCATSARPPSPPLPPRKDESFHLRPASRRQLLAALVFPVAPLLVAGEPTSPFSPVADARGLFQMPPPRLTNRYFLVRAGESEYESLGIINTNPVTKTSVDSGLSEKGKKQMVRAAFDLKEMGACERNCWIWPSITQRAYQAAEIIASVNRISRSYIVPEYTFLDARGLGAYEGKNLDSVSEAQNYPFLSDGIAADTRRSARKAFVLITGNVTRSMRC
ncbi:hypothetical protein EUGRSUZ_B00368 [Eucalyptus grandis]|uniref:Uncharacterized protein n=2 Tax=Eucalyptus grandis TaxID=71139 RepID=A0ACC3LLX4_EUCGR|nr:hypothetical protein EUGRSUZ_B00368 [Eucalyptus grandis]